MSGKNGRHEGRQPIAEAVEKQRRVADALVRTVVRADKQRLGAVQWYAYLVGAQARLKMAAMLSCLYTLPGSPLEGGPPCPERREIGAEGAAGEPVVAAFTPELWCPNCALVRATVSEIEQALAARGVR